MLTEDEIKNIKGNAVTIIMKDAIKGKAKPVPFTTISNGYRVSMSITALREYIEVHHVSIMNPKGATDPAEAEHIAKDILGEGYQFVMHGELVHNNLHFMKMVPKEAGRR